MARGTFSRCRMRNIHIFMSIAIMTVLVASVSARAQGYGEQAPLQFKYVNQGMQTEIYRQQFKASAASAAAQALGGASSGSAGTGQAGTSMNDVVQLGTTYLNVSNTGNGATLNINGASVGQQSSGTNQSNSNSHSAVLNQ